MTFNKNLHFFMVRKIDPEFLVCWNSFVRPERNCQTKAREVIVFYVTNPFRQPTPSLSNSTMTTTTNRSLSSLFCHHVRINSKPMTQPNTHAHFHRLYPCMRAVLKYSVIAHRNLSAPLKRWAAEDQKREHQRQLVFRTHSLTKKTGELLQHW